MRFALIDSVLERAPGRLRAIKQVTLAEEYLADHFPRFPVLPGVMMLEALVQAGRALAAGEAVGDGCQRPLVLGEVRNIRYGNMVRPGHALIVEVTLRQPPTQARDVWDFNGTGTVDGQVAVQGRFTLVPLTDEFYRT